MLVSSFAIVVFAGGLLTLGPSLETGAVVTKPSISHAVPDATLDVTALSSTRFDQTEYTTTPGVVELHYLCDGCGTHTLNFRGDPKLAAFELDVPKGPTKGAVKLDPGTYEIYCRIPGHAATMHATITVG